MGERLNSGRHLQVCCCRAYAGVAVSRPGSFRLVARHRVALLPNTSLHASIAEILVFVPRRAETFLKTILTLAVQHNSEEEDDDSDSDCDEYNVVGSDSDDDEEDKDDDDVSSD